MEFPRLPRIPGRCMPRHRAHRIFLVGLQTPSNAEAWGMMRMGDAHGKWCEMMKKNWICSWTFNKQSRIQVGMFTDFNRNVGFHRDVFTKYTQNKKDWIGIFTGKAGKSCYDWETIPYELWTTFTRGMKWGFSFETWTWPMFIGNMERNWGKFNRTWWGWKWF